MAGRHKIDQPLSSFLTRFHADNFRVSMALASQAVLWRTLNSGSFTDPWPPIFNSIVEKCFWLLAALVLCFSTLAYLFKFIFYFHIVKAEFLDRWRVNYLFAPWIAAILLLQCLLPSRYDRWRGSGWEGIKFFNWGHLNSAVSRALWVAFTMPILLLEIKIYGQWFTKGKRFLSTVANPSTNLSLIGNFVAAQTAARLALLELSLFLFAVGIVHYVVVFVTLYQRLPYNDSFPAQLRPVSFLSIAAPSMACLAWASLTGNFGSGCKMLHFLSLFLFILLVVRPGLFVKAMKKFNAAWWAYAFPVTVLALSSAEYAKEVQSVVAEAFRRAMSMVSLAITMALILLTVLHRKTFFAGDRFPVSSTQNKVLPVTSPPNATQENYSDPALEPTILNIEKQTELAAGLQ